MGGEGLALGWIPMKNSCQPFQAVMKSEILPKWKEVQLWGSGRLKGSVEAVVDLLGWCNNNQPANKYVRKKPYQTKWRMFHGCFIFLVGCFGNLACFQIALNSKSLSLRRFGGLVGGFF